MFMMLSSLQSHCESSSGPFDDGVQHYKRPPILLLRQPTWVASLSVGCYN